MKSLYRSSSVIHGNGMFCRTSIKKGDFIAFIEGPIVRRIEKTKAEALKFPDLIGISGKFVTRWIDPIQPFKSLNHSCQPNAGVTGIKRLIALKDIEAEEEITIDYSTIVGNPLWEMRCSCGTQLCRSTIGSVHTLPKARFEAYGTAIPSHFRSMYVRYNRIK